MMFGHGGFGWLGMVIGLVIVVAAIVGLVWLAVTLIRRAEDRNPQLKTQEQAGLNPREVAAMRYAKGEISREEYQQILSDLAS